MPLNVDNSRIALAIPAPLRLAFRPLFLGGTLFSVFAVAWWAYFWSNPFNWSPYGGPVWWHGHEMLFGFAAAIVVGFLLTAVQSWTGIIGLRGRPLLLLVVAWLAGRLLLAFGDGLTDWRVAAVDVSFLLLATFAMAYPVIKVKQWRNLMFVPILFAMALLNAASHWAVYFSQPELATRVLHATIILFVLIISILGGRVIPAFTSNTTGCHKAVPIRWLEITAIGSILLILVLTLAGLSTLPSAWFLALASLAAVANGWRYLRWGIQYSWPVPLLWSLHIAYAFIPLGFLLLAFFAAGLIDNASAALHSFTVGAMGGMILAMISRVTLGHTGRPLNPHRLVTLAYLFVFLAAIMRVVMPVWWPMFAHWGIAIAGACWVLAYSIYVFFYAPMLLQARADGRPG